MTAKECWFSNIMPSLCLRDVPVKDSGNMKLFISIYGTSTTFMVFQFKFNTNSVNTCLHINLLSNGRLMVFRLPNIT